MAMIRDDFGFREEHGLLKKTARRLLGERWPMEGMRRWVSGEADGADEVWRQVVAAGWPGLVIGEEAGGAGLDWLSMALVMEELGRALAPVPLLESVLAAVAIERSGEGVMRRRWVPEIASGAVIGTVGLGEGGSWEPGDVAATARRDAGGWWLDGTKVHVGFGGKAGVMVAPFRTDTGEIALFVVELAAAGVTVEAEIGVDPTRPGSRVRMEGVRVADEARLPGDGAAVWKGVFVIGWAMLAAEAVGAAEAMLMRTRDYAVERVQFGRPIGSFQAVKHPIVNVMIAVEQARSLAIAAAAALDAAGPASAEMEARMAKAAATEALAFAADRGVQLHGGFGFTWDCDAHFFLKRGIWVAATLGDVGHHRRHLAGLLLG
jgi:alkylation response protein AidB-like acyl-CoA dehydrogenase